MAKRVRKKFNPSDELLEWIKELVLLYLNRHGGEGFWSNLHAFVFIEGKGPTAPAEWAGMSDYAKSKACGVVLDELSARRVVYRPKNYHPFKLLNPLDLIVEALDRDEQPKS